MNHIRKAAHLYQDIIEVPIGKLSPAREREITGALAYVGASVIGGLVADIEDAAVRSKLKMPRQLTEPELIDPDEANDPAMTFVVLRALIGRLRMIGMENNRGALYEAERLMDGETL